ncbi:hypothetical protein ONZ45_g5084 [Pleurotus djamor]|nr:hypothetical protein ONZ45_g5084 [Pleurotus djamor]
MVHALNIPKNSALWKWKRDIAQLVDSARPHEAFPNLCRIDIFIDSLLPRDIETIQYFLGRNITHLELKVSETPFTKLLQEIEKQVPELRTLVCDYSKKAPRSLPPRTEALVGMFRGLPKLKHVAIPKDWANEDVVVVLSQLPHLETLRFTFTPDSNLGQFETLPETLPGGSFPELRTLDVVAPFRKAISCLSPSDTIPNLHSLDIESYEEPARQLRLLVEVIALRCQYISVLRITTIYAEFESSDDMSRMMDSLQTLTACLLQLDEGQISTLGRQLNQLEALGLRQSLEVYALRPRIGVHSLIQFSQSFPRLRKLQLHIDLSAFAFPEVLPHQRFQYLKRLDLGGWTNVRSSVALATFVDELVPDACALGYIDCIPMGWSEVVDIVQTKRKVRTGRA